MSAVTPGPPDQLDKLLEEVRRTISDNRKFLTTLADDSISGDEEEAEGDNSPETPPGEEFEEL